MKRRTQREMMMIDLALGQLIEAHTSLHDETFCKELEASVRVPNTGDHDKDFQTVRNTVERLATAADPNYGC